MDDARGLQETITAQLRDQLLQAEELDRFLREHAAGVGRMQRGAGAAAAAVAVTPLTATAQQVAALVAQQQQQRMQADANGILSVHNELARNQRVIEELTATAKLQANVIDQLIAEKSKLVNTVVQRP